MHFSPLLYAMHIVEHIIIVTCHISFMLCTLSSTSSLSHATINMYYSFKELSYPQRAVDALTKSKLSTYCGTSHQIQTNP